ncbi:MAG: M15 family metallopeptidase [Bacteroidetes bacterium]|nr:M15 family metallopeptidase [Bacteroidota bacterium]
MTRTLTYLFIGFFILASCKDTSPETVSGTLINPEVKDTVLEVQPEPEPAYIIDTLEQKLIDAGLVNVQDSIPGILIDLRYSTTNNFMKQDVYGHLNRAYLQPDVAEDLKKCLEFLKGKDSSLTLLIFDAVRPRSVQQIMWDILDMPVNEKTKFVSNPKNGSVHNYGAAVDITLATNDGVPLDMGADYDDIRLIAYPRHEKAYLDSGMLSLEQLENRKLLRETMRAGGFSGIQTEWWHFNRYSRDVCKTRYTIVE